MTIDFEHLPVPKDGGKAIYGLAEDYFVQRLTAHFRPLGYDCYSEYQYAYESLSGRSPFMRSPNVGHMDADRARILRILQGADGSFGFRFPPQVDQGGLQEKGFEKPDFLAFRSHDGVVGEVGTARMRDAKIAQLDARLRNLRRVVDVVVRFQTFRDAGGPVPWSGMGWRGADYHPAEGPVLIPVDGDRVISTQPTWVPAKVDGIYLYQLVRYRKHALPIGKPVVLPRLSKDAETSLKAAYGRFSAGGGMPAPQSPKSDPSAEGLLGRWPSLRAELGSAAAKIGVAAVVVLAVGFVILSLPATAVAAVTIAGFAALLASELERPAAPILA